MREHVDLSEKEKLEQLHAMVVNSSWLDDDKPCEEFRELLSSLPVETVIVFPRTPYLVRPLQYQSHFPYSQGERHMYRKEGISRPHVAAGHIEIIIQTKNP